MKKMAKLFSLVLTLFCFTGCASSYEEEIDSSCQNDSSSQNEFYEEEIDSSYQNESSYLAEFDGWWYRPDDYVSEGFSLVDIFEVDSSAGVMYPYNSFGMSASMFTCDAVEGSLTINFDILGSITFGYDGESLLNEEGGVEYVRGEPLKPFDTEIFYGKWYEKGDIDNNYFIIDANSYQRFVNYSNSADVPYESGTWSILEMTRTLENGISVDEMTLELKNVNDAFLSSKDYVPSDDCVSLYDNFSNEFYIKEDAIGTPAGDQSFLKYFLICNTWRGYDTEGDEYLLKFSRDGYLTYGICLPGPSKLEINGTWSISDENITLNFSDGTSENITLSEKKITSTYLGVTFEKFGF